jgi:hypothetical protein
MGIQGHQQDS